MENKRRVWSETTEKIWKGVLLYSIAGVLHSIVDPICDLGSGMNNLVEMSQGSYSPAPDGWDIISYILLAGMIVGYVWYMQGVKVFATIQNSVSDADFVGKIRIGILLGLIATGVTFIPFLGWAASILNIIAFIFMLLGFSGLKKSTTFPAKGVQGASSLYIAMILTLVGIVVGIIPVVGGFIEMVLDIVAFFMILNGWRAIKDSDPTEGTVLPAEQ